MAALQILAIATAIAAVCALPWARIHRFHCVPLLPGCRTRPLERSRGKGLPCPALPFRQRGASWGVRAAEGWGWAA
ncbi:MAG: hypothetical protein E6Q29_04710 [Alicycliphilus sp.]|nr:MAG: hypothetical protein E6Q29_04710 [Alicycliphilus sp.]